MKLLWQKIPFILELFINGAFILLYSLRSMEHLPSQLSPLWIEWGISYGVYAAPITILVTMFGHLIELQDIEVLFRKQAFSIIVIASLFITWGDEFFACCLAFAHLLSYGLFLYGDRSGNKKIFEVDRLKEGIFSALKLKPAQLVFLSFSAVILAGTFFLILPFSSVSGESMAFIDALFMATSATCVTGLATKSLATDFSLFGQVVILVLVQIGGLSIMTLYASMTIVLGRSLGMKDRVIMQDLLNVSNTEEFLEMVIDIVKYTFAIELWGAIILTMAFIFDGLELGTAIYYGFFHSVSAFCNAGFSLFDTSFESYATNFFITGPIMVLITLGGLGFVVLKDLKENFKFKEIFTLTGIFAMRKKFIRFGIHTKIVLVTSSILTFGGAIFNFLW